MKKNGKKLGSNLKKAARHIISPQEYEELPLLTADALERGMRKRGGKPAGRPPKRNKKVSLHLRIDPDIRDAFRKTGMGWQSRMNAILREHMPDIEHH